MNDEPIILSEEGRRRQKEILQAAMGAAQARKRRASVKSGMGFCALVLVLWPMVYFVSRSKPIEHPVVVAPVPHVVEKSDVVVFVKRIETDPHILERLSLPPITSTVRHIGDAELMRELADAHQSAGLISVNGKSELIFR